MRSRVLGLTARPLAVVLFAFALVVAAVAVQVVAPRASADAPAVLYVTGNGANLPAGDRPQHAELVDMGYDITVIDDNDVTAADGDSVDLIVIGTTVSVSKIKKMFTDTAVPVVTWEPYLFDDFGMTGAGSAKQGEMSGQDTLKIIDDTHPIAAGFSGDVVIGTKRTNFTFGQPGPAASIIARPGNRNDRASVFAYETGDPMVTGIAPARRVALFPGLFTARSWNAAGIAIFRAAVEWAIGSVTPPDDVNVEPSVDAGPDQTIDVGQTASLAGLADDDGLPEDPGSIVTTWSGPSGVTFSDPSALNATASFAGAGTYQLELSAFDGELTTTDTMTVTVRTPSSGNRALFISNADTPGAKDLPAVARLESLGYEVVPGDDNDVTAADAADFDLIVISSTIAPFRLDEDIADVAVPILVWEARVYDELGFTKFGSRSGEASQRSIKVVDPTHPILDGLTGTPQVYTKNDKLSWGRPEGDVMILTTLTSSTVKATMFAYDVGAQMHNKVAADRRLAFFAGVNGPSIMTATGWELFDSAVEWLSGTNAPPTVNAGDDVAVALGDPLTLSGAATDDGLPDDPGALSTMWAGPGEVSFGDPTAVDSSVSFAAEGTYDLVLSADDGELAADDTVTVTVTPNPLTAVIAADVTTGISPLVVNFDGSGSSDPGGAVTGYAWSFGDGEAGSGETVSHEYQSGVHFATLRVTDSSGLTATATIEIVVDGAPPVAVATADDTAPAGPGTVNFSGALSTSPGGTPQYSWQFPDGSSASGQTASFDFTANGVYPVSLTVTDPEGKTDTDRVVIRVGTPLPPRVSSNLVALYDFRTGTGDVVEDVSGVSPALDLTIDDPSATAWLPTGGLRLNGRTTIVSDGPATKVNQAIVNSGELTVEVWVDPLVKIPDEPGRLVTISPNDSIRNMSVSQGLVGVAGDKVEARLISSQSDSQGYPAADTEDGTLGDELVHVVFTRATNGDQKIWIDGVLTDAANVRGDLSPWNMSYPMALAADPDGKRAWRGDYHLVAIYDRALTHAEICQNGSAGPGRTATDTETAPTACLVSDTAGGVAPLAFNVDGSGSSDHDGTIVSYLWDFGDGTTATTPTVAHTYTGDGDYTLTLTTTDDKGAATTTAIPIVVRPIATLPPRPAGFDDALGLRAGGGLFELEAHLNVEEWLGAPIKWTVQFTEKGGANAMVGTAASLISDADAELPAVSDRVRLSLTVPLGFGNANARTTAGRNTIKNNLLATAAGNYDSQFLAVAQNLKDSGFEDAVIRLGHEFNGIWPPYSSRTNETEFIAAFQHVHGLFSGVSEDFLFEWNSTRGNWDAWGPQAYPGDDYVDIISMDVYWRVDPGEKPWSANRFQVQLLNKMNSIHAFAVAHGKPFAMPEWGLIGADEPRFIEEMYRWFTTRPATGPGSLLYQAYFNAGSSKERLADHPNSKQRMIDLFGSAN